MPWSWPSTSGSDRGLTIQEQPIQVLETERVPVLRREPPRSSGIRLALVGTALVAVVIGLGLLPEAAPPISGVEATLPAPAVATTLVDNDRLLVGIVGPDRWAPEPVPSLNGFTALAGPAQTADGTWWMIGNAGTRAVSLSSEDGAEWELRTSIESESALQFGDLISVRGELVAIGYELVAVNGAQVHRLEAWRSTGGTVWESELLDDGLAFNDMGLVTDGDNVVATVTDHLGISHLFRTTATDPWGEIHLGLPTSREVIRAPQGGFMVSSDDGDVLTSAYGAIWQRNGAIEPGFYSSWGHRVIGVATEAADPSLLVIDADNSQVIQLPDELAGCEVQGGPRDLVAFCERPTEDRFDIYISNDGLIWSRADTDMPTHDLIYEGAMQTGFLLSTPDAAGNRLVIRTGRP